LPQEEAIESATVRPILSAENHALYQKEILELESKLTESLKHNRLLKIKANSYYRRYKQMLRTLANINKTKKNKLRKLQVSRVS